MRRTANDTTEMTRWVILDVLTNQPDVCFSPFSDRLADIMRRQRCANRRHSARSSGDLLVERNLRAGRAAQKTFEVKAGKMIGRILAYVRREGC